MISIFIDHKLERFTKEIRYTFDFIFQTLGFEHRFVSDAEELSATDIVILYSLSEPDEEHIRSLARHYITFSIVFDAGLWEPNGLNSENLRRHLKEGKLLYPTQIISTRGFNLVAENYIDEEVSGGKINFDLVGNVFYHLAGFEFSYYGKSGEDERWQEESSAFYAHRDSPAIDSLIWLMRSLLNEHVQSKKQVLAQKCTWPKGEKSAVLLSHTVDSLQKWNLHSLVLSIADDLSMLFTLNFKQLFHIFWGKIQYLFTNYELYWNFEEYMALEEEQGLRSTFFLGADKCEDLDYGLEDADLQEEIQKLLARGNDIGLLLPNDKLNRNDMLSRKHVMQHQTGQEQVGIRQMDYTMNSEILALHDKICPLYSQSTAFRDVPGYYQNTSYPFYPWVGAKASFLNLPTTYIDRYLRVNKHKVMGLDHAKSEIKAQLTRSQLNGGIMSLDFSLASYHDIHYLNKLYAYIMELIKNSEAYCCTARELSTWWEKRNRVTISEGEYEISIYFADDIDYFTLNILGGRKIREIDGTQGKIDGNMIRYAGVEAQSVSILRFARQ
ncbi:MAG: hypothetical protein ACOCG6_00350 [Candidatus Cloacimonadaceae bacterium]